MDFKFFSSCVCHFPRGVSLDHGVEDHQQLVHAGGEVNLAGFPLLLESLSEGFEDRVVHRRGQGGHVEGRAERFAIAADGPFAAVRAAVVRIRGQTNKGGNLLPVELTLFGQLSDERGGGGLANAGDGLQEFEPVPPVVIGLHEFQNGAIDTSQILVDGCQRSV
jgi:hypothetical protein